MKCSVRKRVGAMRRMAAVLFVAFALVGCVVVGAAEKAAARAPAAPAMMSDPLLGLRYDTGSLRFERLPVALAKKAGLAQQPQWIYARSESGAMIYYVVAGFQRIESDDPEQPVVSVEPDFGAVLRQSGATIEILGVPDLLFDQPPLLPAAERDALLADAARRYVQTWGKAELQAQLSAHPHPDSVPKPLREALKAQGVTLGE